MRDYAKDHGSTREAPMLRFNVRARNAIAGFVLILAGCSHDSPLSPESSSLAGGISAANSESPTLIVGSTGLLADMTDLGTLYTPADNWWNLDVTNAPLDPASVAITAVVKSYDSTAGACNRTSRPATASPTP
jgi:hypothetical protein